jgi:hypothetical protein
LQTRFFARIPSASPSALRCAYSSAQCVPACPS